MPIEVITEDFMRDIGASNLREALSYSAGVILDSQNDTGSNDFTARGGNSGVFGVQGNQSESSIKLRGFTTSEQLRSGFKRAQSTDAVSIGRIEVVRGPAALLYGTGNFGGIVNYIPKRPPSEPLLRIAAQVGSHGFYRGEFEAGTPLGAPGSWWRRRSAGVRLMAARTESDDWTDFNSTSRGELATMFAIEPFKGTRVNLDLEIGFNHRRGIGFQRIYDNYTFDANDFVMVPTLPSPRQDTYRWSGPDTYRRNFYWNGLLEVEQKIGDRLTLLVAANLSNSEYYSRILNVAGLPVNEGPLALRVPYRGADRILRTGWNRGSADQDRVQTRAELNYRFELFGGVHNLLLGRTDARFDQASRNHGGSPNYRRLDDYSYFRYDDSARTFSFNNDQTNSNFDQGTYAVYQGSLLRERLTIVAGARYDRADTLRDVRNVEGVTTSQVRRPGNVPTDATTPQFGATFKINEAVSIYALRSGGLAPNYYDRDGAGNTFEPVRARSREFGIKVDLLQGRLSGTISAFRVDRDNATRSFFWAPAPYKNSSSNPFDPNAPIFYRVVINQNRPGHLAVPWIAQGLADGTLRSGQLVDLYPSNPTDVPRLDAFFEGPDGGAGGPGLHNVGGNNASKNRGASVPVDDRSEGFDLQLVYTPTNALSFVGSYAYLDRYITAGARTFVSQPGETRWDIWYNKAGLSNFATVGDASTYNGSLAKGLRLDDTPYHQASVWGKYAVQDGRLKNLGVGGGVRWLGPREFRSSAEGSGSGSIEQPVYTKEEWTVDLALSYGLLRENRKWTFQLNVRNLLNDQSRLGDLYKQPITWRFISSVEF